jgi:hypothetical protein
MKVYHGSYTKIDEIDLSKAQPNKDFGKGFYVTKYRHHAETWAEIIGSNHNTAGVVTEFDFCNGEFSESVCKIKRFETYNEEWLDFVVKNRNKKSDFKHDYDIVEGPVADDKIQHRIDFFLSGKITKEQFLKELSWYEPTHQICFCTFNSLQTIDPIDNEKRLDVTMISEPLLETLMIDRNLNEVEATDLFYSSKTFSKLADETTEFYKKPWQEIYELLKQELKSKSK